MYISKYLGVYLMYGGKIKVSSIIDVSVLMILFEWGIEAEVIDVEYIEYWDHRYGNGYYEMYRIRCIIVFVVGVI